MTAIKLQQLVFNELSFALLTIWKRHCRHNLMKICEAKISGKMHLSGKIQRFHFLHEKKIPKEIKRL